MSLVAGVVVVVATSVAEEDTDAKVVEVISLVFVEVTCWPPSARVAKLVVVLATGT